MWSETYGKLFVYGTLCSGESNFSALEAKVTNGTVATVNGVLMLHDIAGKEFPFLVEDIHLLATLFENSGISAHPVMGELYDILDPRLLKEIDQLEGIVAESALTVTPLTNIYKRETVRVNVGNETFDAFAYVANPRKDHSERLITKLSTKIVIPNGDWKKYLAERNGCSITREPSHQASFGMETEFLPLLKEKENPKRESLFFLKRHHVYQIRSRDGKTRRFPKITSLLSQSLYGHLQRSGLGATMAQYYELRPKDNLRFVIPYGISYVEGERLYYDGVQVPIIPIVRLSVNDKFGINVVPQSTDHEHPRNMFLEVAGVPAAIEPGFATAYATQEMIRRYHLFSSLEHIVAVELDGREFGRLNLVGHSSHYNLFINPRINESLTLENATTIAYMHEDAFGRRPAREIPDDKGKPKFATDVSYVLGATFGPLLSFLLTGESGYVEYRPRANNRVEYRNTVIHDPRQLSVGIAAFVASVNVVSKKIKQAVSTEASRFYGKSMDNLTNSEVREVYTRMTPDQFLGLFGFSVPDLTFLNSRFRGGFRLESDSDYHGIIKNGAQATIDMIVNGKRASLRIQSALKSIFYDPEFNQEFREITTPEEYSRAEQYIHGRKKVQIYTRPRKFKAKDVASLIRISTGRGVPRHYTQRSNFSDLFTEFLFLNPLQTFEDGSHRLTLRLNNTPDSKDSSLYLGQLPIEAILEKRDESGWAKVDAFTTYICLSNYQKLITTMDRLHNAAGNSPIWEAYFKLK